jgi:hypothetical protein
MGTRNPQFGPPRPAAAPRHNPHLPRHNRYNPAHPSGLNAWDRALKRATEGKLPAWMIPEGETQFERVVREAGVAGAGIEEAARNRAVREWVHRNYGRYFVPEKMLEACGLGVTAGLGV